MDQKNLVLLEHMFNSFRRHFHVLILKKACVFGDSSFDSSCKWWTTAVDISAPVIIAHLLIDQAGGG